MNFFFDILRDHPALGVFLTLALGFTIGKLRIGSFKLGPMLGTLFAGVIIGQLHIEIPPVVKTVFFDLFLFATGYKVGPQFFYGLKKDALPQLLLTVVICVSCLLTAYLISLFLKYDIGTAAGLLAGAFSESTVIGTASDAIQKLSLTDQEKNTLINNIPVAYAVTYLLGTVANVWFLSSFAPKLMGINLQEESAKLSKKFAGSEQEPGINSAYHEWVLRAIKVNSKWNDKTVSDIERSIPDKRIIVERIRRDSEISDPTSATVIHSGDVIVIAARQEVMLKYLQDAGEEVHDRELLDFPIINKNVIVSKKEITGQTLHDIAGQYGTGIMLNKLFRAQQEMPFESGTVIQAGDILSISGRKEDVERAVDELGFVEVKTVETDLIFVAAGIVLGGLLGMLALNVGGVAITLSVSGGALVMGLIFGWIHSKRPRIGYIPESALWIFDTLGLATFLGIIGLAAGPSFISGLELVGFGIIFSGLIVALLPHVIGLFFGRFVLKMNPVILLGAQAGAGTTTTALKALQETANSKFPVLGYTIPYALGNILLTAWGPVIVSLMSIK